MEKIYYFIPVMIYILFCTGVCLFSQNTDRSEKLDCFRRLLWPFLLFVLSIRLQKNIMLVLPAGLLAYAIGIVIAFTFPVLFHLTHRGEPDGYFWPGDFRFGFLAIILLLSLADVFSFWNYTICVALITGIEILFLVPSIFYLSYFVYYRECINESAVQALLNTNKLEAKEYVRLISPKILFLLAVIFLLLASVMFRINLSVITGSVRTGFPILSLVISIVVTVELFACGSHTVFKKTGLMKFFVQTRNHNQKLKDSPLSGSDYPSHINMESLLTGNNTNFGTILLVIGESANRLHMKAFSYYDSLS